MVAKEFLSSHQEEKEEEEEACGDYYDDEDETLSLCDLPTYSSDSAQWDDYLSKEGGKSLKDGDDGDDYFEFFSGELTKSSSTHETSSKNIIFCGKLIPFKEPQQQQQQPLCNKFEKAKSMSRTTSVKSTSSSDSKGSKSNNNLCDYASMKKVSLMRSTTKSKWYLFMFGMPRVSTEMELSDIKNRQSRKAPVAMIPAAEHGGEMVVKSMGEGKNRGGGLTRILKSLEFGCLSSNVVKATFV